MALTYNISDLAKEFDLTTRAMRFYEDMGLLQPERTGPGGRSRVYSGRDRTRLKLIDMYDSPRDTGAQLQKFLLVLAEHQKQLEAQMTDLQANLDELKEHQREARALLATSQKKSAATRSAAKPLTQPKGDKNEPART
jgi:DNA-binding transcriptional MerR regulator